MAWQACTVGYSADSGSARAVREVYLNPLNPRLCHLSAGQLCNQQPAENSSNTPSHFHALEMATLAFKPYTYVPTPPRSKSAATGRRPAPKQASIFDKLQQIRPSGASLSTQRAAAADDDGAYRPGIQGTATVYGRSNKANDDENDDDCDFPTIEELLLTKLQEQGFATEDRGSDKTTGVEGVASEGRRGSVDQSRSAQSNDSGGSPDDPIFLLGNDDSSAAEADDISLRAESTEPDASLLDRPENAIDSTSLASPCSSDGWYHIDDFPETAQRLQLAEQGASTSNPMPPQTPSLRLSSEPLHDSIISTDSQAMKPSSSPLLHHCRASPETQLSQEGHLHTGRGVADEHELLETLLIDEGARKQQEVEQGQELDKGNRGDEDERPQQEINVMAPVVTAERAGGSPRPANRRQSLCNLDPSLEPNHNEAGSRSGGDSDNKLNSTDLAEDDEKKPRPAKRKQPSSSHGGPARTKRRRPLLQNPPR